MNIAQYKGQPTKLVSSHIEKAISAWKRFDDDERLALDEAYERDIVQIRGQDGSLLRGEIQNLGHTGTKVLDLRTAPDGSGTLYDGLTNLNTEYYICQTVIRHPNGTFEGYRLRSSDGGDSGPPGAPRTIDDIFGSEAPKRTRGESILKLEPLSSEEAEKTWNNADQWTRSWTTYNVDEIYHDRAKLKLEQNR